MIKNVFRKFKKYNYDYYLPKNELNLKQWIWVISGLIF